MTSFYDAIHAVKQEPVDASEMVEPDYALDDEPDDFGDPDADVDDKLLAHVESVPRARESTVRNVTLTPVDRPAPLVDASRATPHDTGVQTFDAYDEPSDADLAASRAGGDRALGDSAQSAATFVNYIMARNAAGGLLVAANEGGGYSSRFIHHWLSAPPHRSVPASQSAAAKFRLASIVVDWTQFLELCATPRPGEPACHRGNACEALNIRNAHGQRINNTPWVAHWFAAERAKLEGSEREAFRREQAKRMCIQCEIFFAARAFAHSSSTNTGVDAGATAKLAVGWHVLVETDGQFRQHQTLGPDATCFNGFVGNVPRPALNGWSIRATAQTSRVEFQPPYQQYAAQNEQATEARDATTGF